MFNSSTPLVLKTMKVDKAAHCVGTQDQVSQNLAPWPMLGFRTTLALGAPARLARLGLFKAWRSPRPSVLRKLASYLEIFSEKISSFAKRFLSIRPPNTQNLWPMARRCKGIPKTHFHVWHLQMADVCGKCLLSKLFWSKFSSA